MLRKMRWITNTMKKSAWRYLPVPENTRHKGSKSVGSCDFYVI